MYTNNEQLSKLLYKAKDLRIFLNQFCYTDESKYKLIEHITKELGPYLFNIEFNPVYNCINIKVKKTELKNNNLIHNSQSYYGIFNKIFINFFREEKNNFSLIFNNQPHSDIFSLDDLFDATIIHLLYNK